VTYAVLRKGSGLKQSGKPLVALGKPVESLGVEVDCETLWIKAATDATDMAVACSATVKHGPAERQGRAVFAEGRGANRWEVKASDGQRRHPVPTIHRRDLRQFLEPYVSRLNDQERYPDPLAMGFHCRDHGLSHRDAHRGRKADKDDSR